MFVCEMQKGVASEQKGGFEFEYLSIGVVIDDEVKEIDRHFFASKNRASLTLIELSQKRTGKNFAFTCELKTEVSKKKNEYTYLSIQVPLNGKLVEADRHFFSSDAAFDLIAESELQNPAVSNTTK